MDTNTDWYRMMREAGHSHDVCVSEERSYMVTDELADITTSELVAELMIRIECTNGLDFIPRDELRGLIDKLGMYLATY